jgi:hypothetical protein
MPLEAATYISQLDETLPTGTGADGGKAEGDNVLRLIKAVLKNSFASISGAVTVTHTQLNTVTAKAAKAGDTYTGTHDFTGATISGSTITATTQSAGNSSTNAATTAFVATAVSGVTASGTAPALTIVTGTSESASSGQHIIITNVATTTVTLPASPSAGDLIWITVGNGLTTNVVARNGLKIMSTAADMTLDSAYASVQLRYINTTIGWSIY